MVYIIERMNYNEHSGKYYTKVLATNDNGISWKDLGIGIISKDKTVVENHMNFTNNWNGSIDFIHE